MIWLIAEDETDILSLLAMVFEVWGHKPLLFPTGQKVWDWLDKIEAGTYVGDIPDFALMDIRMPGKKGNEIAHRMRTIPALKNIPLVLMTAFSLSEAEKEEFHTRDGVDAVISKPLPAFDVLQSTLNRIIQNKSLDQSGVNQSR